MSQASGSKVPPVVRSRVRVVTAASLFDGHDAAINIMRRILQSQGAEVIHLGHDRSVDEIVQAAVQEDASAIAVSSYQGGHMEFFRYLSARLREQAASHIRVYPYKALLFLFANHRFLTGTLRGPILPE